MNRSRACRDLAAMPEPLRDEIFFPRSDRDTIFTEDQGVAALHYEHVFVEGVNVRRGNRRLLACPESHLTIIHAVIHVALDTRR